MPAGGGLDFHCTFCRIVAGRETARWVSPPDPIVQARLITGWAPGLDGGGAACFANRLRWERVMLLAVPLGHLTQQEMWRGSSIGVVARLAVEIGLDQCPEGFRLLSNFGRAAHQSQPHAHLHIVSGTADDLERAPRTDTGLSKDFQPHRVFRGRSPVGAVYAGPVAGGRPVAGRLLGIGVSVLPWPGKRSTSLKRVRRRDTGSWPTFSRRTRRKTAGPRVSTSRAAGNSACTSKRGKSPEIVRGELVASGRRSGCPRKSPETFHRQPPVHRRVSRGRPIGWGAATHGRRFATGCEFAKTSTLVTGIGLV